MASLRILVFNWNESVVHSLCKLEHAFEVAGTCVLGQSRPDGISTWDFARRPLVDNLNLVVSSGPLKQNLLDGVYDLAICFCEADLVYLQEVELPKLFCPLVSPRQLLGDRYDDPALRQQHLDQLPELTRDASIVYLSRTLQDAEMGGYGLPGPVLSEIPCISPDDYGGYTGAREEVLLANEPIGRRPYLKSGLQNEVLTDVPHFCLDVGAEFSGASQPKDWEGRKACFREYRAFFSVVSEDFRDGPMPLPQLEAMMTGMPVVTAPHPLSIVEDGVHGFIAEDVPALQQRLNLLIEDIDLARDLGANARRAVMDRYPFKDYLEGWARAIEECAGAPAEGPPPVKRQETTQGIAFSALGLSPEAMKNPESPESPPLAPEGNPKDSGLEISFLPGPPEAEMPEGEPTTVELAVVEKEPSPEETVVNTPPSTMLNLPELKALAREEEETPAPIGEAVEPATAATVLAQGAADADQKVPSTVAYGGRPLPAEAEEIAETSGKEEPEARGPASRLLLLSPSSGGALSPVDRALAGTLQWLGGQGWDCEALCYGPSPSPVGEEKSPVHYVAGAEECRELLGRINPDLVLAHQDFVPDAVRWCGELRKSCVVLVSDYQHFAPTPAAMPVEGPPDERLFYRPYGAVIESHRQALREVDAVLCASEHLAGLVRQTCGCEARVWPLPVALPVSAEQAPETANRDKLVMDVSAVPGGLKLLAEIARRLPEESFLIAGASPEEAAPHGLGDLPNLSFQQETESSHLFSLARVYLAPTEWPEPNGLCVLEAMAWGVPVVAGALGAFPEVVGEAGLLVHQVADPSAWVEMISALLHNQALYAHFVEQGRRRASEFTAERQLPALREMLEDVKRET